MFFQSFNCFFLLLAPLLLFTFFKATSLKRSRRSHNHPPGPTPLPIIGNLLELGRLPHASLRNLATVHGPLFYLTLGQIPFIVASSKETASEILNTQDLCFCNRPRLIASSLLSYGCVDLAFSPYNERWKQLRRFCNAAFFGPNKVQAFRPVREEEAGAFMNAIRKRSSDGMPIDLSKMAVCLFNNVIYRELFGKRAPECGEIRRLDLVKAVFDLLLGFSIGDLFPGFWWLDYATGWRYKLDRSFRQMDRLFEAEIRGRQLRRASGGGKEEDEDEDLLSVLLRCEDERDPLLGFLLSRNETKALLMDMFFTATKTNAVILEWGISELIKNPEAMKKAREEVRRVVSPGKSVVGEDDLLHLDYLKLIISETLRLHPAFPLLGYHECMKDTQINGYDVPAKTRAIINVSAIGRDPKVWDDPQTFRPERFMNSRINYKGSYFELIPFGSGRRICPGMAHGIAGVELALANILYSFNWEMPEGKMGKDLDMEERGRAGVSRKNPLVLMAKSAMNDACL